MIANTLTGLLNSDPAAKQFGLCFDPQGIRSEYGVWTVPVASGVAGGSAYDLSRAISHIQEETERLTHLSINLFLNPFLQRPSSIGNH